VQISRIGRYKTNLKFKNQKSKLRNSKIFNFVFCILHSRRVGFTLLELVIVIFIISLATALIMPSFWTIGESQLKAEARRIGGALRYIHDEAVGKKQTYLFKVNMNDNYWEFKSNKENKMVYIGEKVEVVEVWVPSLGTVSVGEVITEFGPTGAGEPIVLHLKKDKSEYTIIFNHLNGRAKIVEGYTF